MAGRDPTRIAETLRGVAAGTTMYRISHGQSRMISAGILSAAADVVETVAAVTAERDRAMQACEQIGAQLVAAREALATVRPGSDGLVIRPLEWEADHGDGYRLFGVDTPVGRFTYGTDRHGVCYWQSPYNPGRDTETEEQARAEAETLWRTLAAAEIYKFALRAALNPGAPDAD